jgi:hypothetical protein
VGEEAAVSRFPVSPDDPDLGHLTEGGSVTVSVVDGADGVRARAVYESAEDAPRVVKSVRVPEHMLAAAEAVGHPDGFSGVVREALDAWLRRDEAVDEVAAVRQALATVSGFVARHAA